MSYIQQFFRSFIGAFPKIQNLSNRIQNRNNLIVNYPLLLKPTSSGRFSIYTDRNISKGNDLILLSMGQCVFSTGFTSASQSQEMQISDVMKTLTSQYESMKTDFMERMKVYIQFIASVQGLKKGEMPLKDYGEYVLNLSDQGLIKSQINSRYLLDLYQSWQINNKITYSYMKTNLLKRTEEEEFLNACNKGRLVIRNAGNSPFLFAAPFIDKLDHSFDPNCQFQMIYFPHRRSPFVRIRAIKDIKIGDRPTINYGKLNNYEMLIRYGFCVKNNPYSAFMLPLNFESIIEIFNKNIEWKQKQLLHRNMKLKNYIKMLPNGQLAEEDLLMMRILICDSQNPSQNRLQSNIYDKLINKFISDHAQNMRKNIKINSLQVSTNKNIKTLEDQEISILDRYLSIHNQ